MHKKVKFVDGFGFKASGPISFVLKIKLNIINLRLKPCFVYKVKS